MEVIKVILMVEVEVACVDHDSMTIAKRIQDDAEFIGEAIAERVSEQSLWTPPFPDPVVTAKVFGSMYVEQPPGEWTTLRPALGSRETGG